MCLNTGLTLLQKSGFFGRNATLKDYPKFMSVVHDIVNAASRHFQNFPLREGWTAQGMQVVMIQSAF